MPLQAGPRPLSQAGTVDGALDRGPAQPIAPRRPVAPTRTTSRRSACVRWSSPTPPSQRSGAAPSTEVARPHSGARRAGRSVRGAGRSHEAARAAAGARGARPRSVERQVGDRPGPARAPASRDLAVLTLASALERAPAIPHRCLAAPWASLAGHRGGASRSARRLPQGARGARACGVRAHGHERGDGAVRPRARTAGPARGRRAGAPAGDDTPSGGARRVSATTRTSPNARNHVDVGADRADRVRRARRRATATSPRWAIRIGRLSLAARRPGGGRALARTAAAAARRRTTCCAGIARGRAAARSDRPSDARAAVDRGLERSRAHAVGSCSQLDRRLDRPRGPIDLQELTAGRRARSGIDAVAQAVAEEVESEHQQRDGEARKQRQVRRVEDVRAPAVQHRAPARRRRLHAEARESSAPLRR